MIRKTSIIIVTLVILSFLPSMTQQASADILPRVRCRFSKMTYYYGEDVKFYLDIDVYPGTKISELYLEEHQPDGSINKVNFGVLDEGNYEFIIGKAGSPAGYRECILVSKRENQVGHSEVMRWKGGYIVEEPQTKITPTSPIETIPPAINTETTETTTTKSYLDQSFLPVFIILVIVVIAAILIRNLRSRSQRK